MTDTVTEYIIIIVIIYVSNKVFYGFIKGSLFFIFTVCSKSCQRKVTITVRRRIHSIIIMLWSCARELSQNSIKVLFFTGSTVAQRSGCFSGHHISRFSGHCVLNSSLNLPLSLLYTLPDKYNWSLRLQIVNPIILIIPRHLWMIMCF